MCDNETFWDAVQGLSAAVGAVVAWALLRVTRRQAAIAKAQQDLMETQRTMMFELERGRLFADDRRGRKDKSWSVTYRNVGKSTVEFLGLIYWDLGPANNLVREPKVGAFASSSMHRLLPPEEELDMAGQQWPSGLTMLNHPVPGCVRIGVRAYYRSLGEVRMFQHGMVFYPGDGRQDTYNVEAFVGHDFERDLPGNMEHAAAGSLVRSS